MIAGKAERSELYECENYMVQIKYADPEPMLCSVKQMRQVE